MAWIEVHDNLPDHNKTLDVAEALKMDSDLVVGKLIRLWTWALTNREDGVFKARDVTLIADVMRYRGKAQKLVDALVCAGFLDRIGDGYAIHDWDQHVCMLREKREKVRAQTRERVKRYRDQKKADDVTDGVTDGVTQCNALHERYVTPESNACNAVTVPYRTVPYNTTTATAREEKAAVEAKMPTETPPQMRDTAFAALVDYYTQNIRMPSPIEAESISKWLDDMPAKVIAFAIKQGALSGIRTWRGVETILTRWQGIGVKDLPGAQAAQREWANRGHAGQQRAAPTPARREMNYNDFDGFARADCED